MALKTTCTAIHQRNFNFQKKKTNSSRTTIPLFFFSQVLAKKSGKVSGFWSNCSKERLSSMTLLFLLLSPPTKWHCCDVTMHAVQFWGQGSSYLSDQRVPYLWLKKKRRERGKTASALRWNMDMQTLIHFAHIQTKGAA